MNILAHIGVERHELLFGQPVRDRYAVYSIAVLDGVGLFRLLSLLKLLFELRCVPHGLRVVRIKSLNILDLLDKIDKAVAVGNLVLFEYSIEHARCIRLVLDGADKFIVDINSAGICDITLGIFDYSVAEYRRIDKLVDADK